MIIKRALSRFFVILLLATLLTLSSCLGRHLEEKEAAFQQLFSQVVMNKHLELNIIEPQSEDFPPGVVDLILENKSDHFIHFTPGFNAKIFAYSIETHRWTEIGNKISYSGNDIILYPKGNNLHSVTIVGVLPDLSGPSSPKNLRIVVAGTIYRDNKATNEQVGAYTDVNWPP